MATEKLVDLEVILSISFEQEYLEGLEGFKLIFFVWKKWPLKLWQNHLDISLLCLKNIF